ncbi:DUF5994 family protein [Nocardia sp. NPDC059091]|uniref:DUF5994 family protein n=1 Tax=unclassified Nocardia TaxID=2637762 RepID=UPI00369B7E43
MTPQHNADRPAGPAHQLRLALDAGGTGAVDGFWWPHSRDLAIELPDLLTALTGRLGPIHRVIHHRYEWAAAPSTLDFDGRQVRLDGYRRMPVRILEVYGADIGTRLILRVITPVEDIDMVAVQQRWESEGGEQAGVSAWDRAASQ